MRVLTWNLFHGRAQPGAGRDLLAEFAAALQAWEWDVALLQEVPPWWPPALPGDARAMALTSRNALPGLRRTLARRWPDVVKSGGGGANAILVRGAAIAEHRVQRLRTWPERRVVHAVRAGDMWLGNVHAQVRPETAARADVALAARTLLAWADGAPTVLGGDFNVPAPVADGLCLAGGHGVDHVLVHGLRAAGPAEVPARGRLSDHAPVVVALEGADQLGRPATVDSQHQGGHGP